jgi:hypothetical protein
MNFITWIKVITKLPNSEQSYKGKVKTYNYTPKYIATGERQSVGFPVDSGFATARQSRERASAQRESTEVDRIEVEIEKLREQLGQYKQETYLQFKQFIYTTRIPQRCHQLCNEPGIYWKWYNKVN